MTDLSFIVKMVIYKCRELGNPVTETLAAYVAQTQLNDGKHSFLILVQALVASTWSSRSLSQKPNSWLT